MVIGVGGEVQNGDCVEVVLEVVGEVDARDGSIVGKDIKGGVNVIIHI